MKERDFQASLISKIYDRWPECVVLKNDANYIQGIPDLLVLNDNKWAALEVKRSTRASHRPNQDYYVKKFDAMSFCRFVHPGNAEEVLDEMALSWQS